MALRGFPVTLPLEGQPVLVVGGGELALRKARLVAKSACRLTIVAPNPLPALVALASEIRERDFTPADLENHRLVFAATDEEAVDISVAEAAHKAGVLVNVPDKPRLCSFIMPAIIDREPISIAITSGGASPVLVRRLRERLEAALEPGLGKFARFLDGFRSAVKATRDDETARRRFWEAVIDGPVAKSFLAGDEKAAHEKLMLALNDAQFGQQAGGRVALVGAGPGDPDLLTLRALRVLQDADVVVHDKLVDERIMDYVRRDARRHYVGKSKSHHTMSQEAINQLLVAEAKAGHRVVRLKGGDPFMFGRGGEELEVLRAEGIPVEIVPGITAALGCGASTTIPVTHRDHAPGVTFVTGHGKDGEPDLDWQALARLRHTLVIYMGLTAAGAIARRLVEAGMSGDTPAALVEKGTRPDQKLVVGTLEALPDLAAAHGLTGPAIIIVGSVVTLADPARITELVPAHLRQAV
ncbi:MULTISPECIES: siroheme synthase CysG [unclassified Azospirillum]|uniref:siroheme synthase CysG n=1 Tax=unclassified Azospirillum TaxID=2630922 RepID=UPI000B746354|nr:MULTISPECIES: siroheme synthase CysG [unclassified Azospirillum]SNS48253.1 uroporphyrin-III C-methyltransferase / precorrin-2 dehydrogenase / sirohydrochlorin ferrochelatase [Azospirillum sp. RU38E]SNS67419.1 uroporphyrin-III C-methyltransferase / precorrin-2 dehydrogenase / sirohydrochlorin ferrochelatase [Azospirillum sp. RU37A]